MQNNLSLLVELESSVANQPRKQISKKQETGAKFLQEFANVYNTKANPSIEPDTIIASETPAPEDVSTQLAAQQSQIVSGAKSEQNIARAFNGEKEMSVTSFLNPDDPEVQAIVNQLNLSALKPEDKAVAIFNYIVENYNYQEDTEGVAWKEAGVTIQDAGGDCEDLVNLAGSLMLAAGIPEDQVSVYVSKGNQEVPGHVVLGYTLNNGQEMELDIAPAVAYKQTIQAISELAFIEQSAFDFSYNTKNITDKAGKAGVDFGVFENSAIKDSFYTSRRWGRRRWYRRRKRTLQTSGNNKAIQEAAVYFDRNSKRGIWINQATRQILIGDVVRNSRGQTVGRYGRCTTITVPPGNDPLEYFSQGNSRGAYDSTYQRWNIANGTKLEKAVKTRVTVQDAALYFDHISGKGIWTDKATNTILIGKVTQNRSGQIVGAYGKCTMISAPQSQTPLQYFSNWHNKGVYNSIYSRWGINIESGALQSNLELHNTAEEFNGLSFPLGNAEALLLIDKINTLANNNKLGDVFLKMVDGDNIDGLVGLANGLEALKDIINPENPVYKTAVDNAAKCLVYDFNPIDRTPILYEINKGSGDGFVTHAVISQLQHKTAGWLEKQGITITEYRDWGYGTELTEMQEIQIIEGLQLIPADLLSRLPNGLDIQVQSFRETPMYYDNQTPGKVYIDLDSVGSSIFPRTFDSNLGRTLVHEVGHLIDWEFFDAQTMGALSMDGTIPHPFGKGPYINRMAGGSNPREDFAETFAQYIFDPEQGKLICPDKYYWFEQNLSKTK